MTLQATAWNPLAVMTSLDAQLLAQTAERVAAHSGPTFLIGIAGGVAVGKTTLAHRLAEGLNRGGITVEVVATDGFLRPNRELEAAGLNLRKGFPETYDRDAFHRFLAELGAGRAAASPVYSHVTYDIVPGEVRRVPARGVVIVEGVNVLQTPQARAAFGLSLYVDADPADAKAWYLARLARIVAEEPESFIARIADPVRRDALVEAAWTQINLVNLRDHIAPTMAHADVVVRKRPDHALQALAWR
ncbi:hypothetical protein [Phenylobacterium sp.]|uniref:type I pantothenate kinase n=1 Tax=Phenylobacterium sp. TaxID=1871053 RepID=UPI00301E54E8